MNAPEPAPAPPPCWRCGAALRPAQRFCGHCGLALSPDDFLTVARPPARERLGLGLALATYFAVLACLIALLVAEVESVRSVLAFDLGLLALGVILLIVFWQELGTLLGAPTRISPTQAGIVALTLALVFGLVQALSALFPALFSDVMESYHAEGVGLAFAIFQIGPLTAFAEEILFRGIVLAGLRKTFPDGAAVAVSAAMFATIHLSPVAFFHTGALGLLFGWLTLQTRSLWPAILLHTAWNTTMVLLDA